MTDNWVIAVDPELSWATAYNNDQPHFYGDFDEVCELLLGRLGVDMVDGVGQDGGLVVPNE